MFRKKIKKNKKNKCLPLNTPVLLHKNGVQWGIHCNNMRVLSQIFKIKHVLWSLIVNEQKDWVGTCYYNIRKSYYKRHRKQRLCTCLRKVPSRTVTIRTYTDMLQNITNLK